MLTVKKDTRIKPKLYVDSIKRHDLVCNMNTFTNRRKIHTHIVETIEVVIKGHSTQVLTDAPNPRSLIRIECISQTSVHDSMCQFRKKMLFMMET